MSKARRIALVSAFPPGKLSLNEYGYHLALAFAAHPDVDEVVVLADRMPEPAPELDLGPKIRVERVWSFNSVSSGPKILSALRRVRPDGVVFNLQAASFGDREAPAALGLLVPMLARWTGNISGVIAHNIIAGVDLEKTVLKGRPLRQMLVKTAGAVVTRAMLSASYMTVTLKTYQEILERQFPRATAGLSLVPHGTFEVSDRPWIGQKERPLRIVTMGKFGTYKRLETLLAGFDLLRRDSRFSGAELVIGGTDHPNTPGYVESIRDARRGDAGVVFAGYVAEADVPAFFEGSRISVFDYQSTTGSSGVLHQTASYGSVPVFPRIGDFVDLCEDEGMRGLHYEPGDAEGLADALRSILDDPAGAEDIARANLQASKGMPMSEVAEFHLRKIYGGKASRTALDRTEPAN